MLFEIYLGYAKQFYGMFIFFIRGDYFRFGSVFIYIKKVTKLKFKKKNRNWFKPTGFGSVRFFRTKTGSNQFDLVFLVWLRFFPVWLRFFPVFSI
jgi:hypothetical protein